MTENVLLIAFVPFVCKIIYCGAVVH